MNVMLMLCLIFNFSSVGLCYVLNLEFYVVKLAVMKVIVIKLAVMKVAIEKLAIMKVAVMKVAVNETSRYK